MALGSPPPIPDEAVLRIARLLARWRYRFAPPGSLASRLLRRLATAVQPPRPPTATLRQRYLAWAEPRARETVWDGAAPLGHVLPARPDILVLKLDHIGDLAVALPALRRLRDAFPDAVLTLVCGPWNAGLAGGTGLFDRVAAFDAFNASRRIDRADDPDRLARFAALDLGAFDLAIDLRHEPDTRTLLFAVKARWRAGFQAPASAGGDRLDLAIPDSQDSLRLAGFPPLHAGARLDALAAAVSASFGGRTTGMAPTRDGADTAQRPYIVVAPGAGAPIKRWPLDRLTALARALAERHDVDVVVAGSAGDGMDAVALASVLPPGRVRDLTGTLPLAELPTLLRGARLFIGYDSGPSHLAAGLGVPTVCVFAGVSDAAVWHPVGPAVTVVAGTTGCSPCRLTHPDECPNEQACLGAIRVETVQRACETRMAYPQ